MGHVLGTIMQNYHDRNIHRAVAIIFDGSNLDLSATHSERLIRSRRKVFAK